MYERSIHVRSILRSLLPRLVHAEGSLSGSEMLSILRGLRAMRKSYDHLRILSHTNQKAKVFENQKTPDYSQLFDESFKEDNEIRFREKLKSVRHTIPWKRSLKPKPKPKPNSCFEACLRRTPNDTRGLGL